MTLWRQAANSGVSAISARPKRPPTELIVRDQLEPDDRDPEQEERYDQRAEGVREMKVIGAGIEAGQKAGKPAGRRQPVNQRYADEHDADNADNPWHWLGHEKGLAEARASGKRQSSSVTFAWGGASTRPNPAGSAGDRCPKIRDAHRRGRRSVGADRIIAERR